MHYLGQLRTKGVFSPYGPQQVFYDAEDNHAEENTDQSITYHYGAEGRAKPLEQSCVKGDADLKAPICNAGATKVCPGGDSSTGAEDQPEAADGFDIGQQVH